MFKLFHKKLNKKGFTLAELLVVIAILAILIAIAVPVFTNMIAEANLRVNQANVRTVRSAAVAHILTNLGGYDNSSTAQPFNKFIGTKGSGWVATAKVDNNGNIENLLIYVIEDASTQKDGISIAEQPDAAAFGDSESTTFFLLDDDLSSKFATVKPSMGSDTSTGGANVYCVQAVITDLDDRGNS